MAKENKYVKEAIEEAKRNLTGEDLDKCIEALHNWAKNTSTYFGGDKEDGKSK